ncbi:MAG: Yip1 family protein [Burkholderiaceae bacterium]
MALIDRVKAILLTPKTEWPVIEQEPGDIAGIYKDYLVFLVAIPALAGFIGMSIVGLGGIVPVRVPFFSGLVNGILHYLLTLVLIYVLALIVDALAPTFGGTKNALAAFKLVAYGMTASLVAGALTIIPVLAPLAVIGSLYSLYLFYVGLPVLMKCPPEKALPYTAVLVVCAIIASVLLAAITKPAIAPLASSGGPGAVAIDAPGSREARTDTARLDDASRKPQPVGSRDPIPSDVLKAVLPDSIGDLRRVTLDVQSGAAMGIQSATAEAEYQGGDRSVNLKIVDMGGLAGLAAIANWANITGEKETATSIEKTYKDGSRTIKESARKDGSRAEYSVILENGVIIEIEGRGVDLRALKTVAESMSLSKLESYKRKG